jgi:hypothetical protein
VLPVIFHEFAHNDLNESASRCDRTHFSFGG